MYQLNQIKLIVIILSFVICAVLSSVLFVTHNNRNVMKYCCAHDVEENFFSIIGVLPNCSSGDWNFKCSQMYRIEKQYSIISEASKMVIPVEKAISTTHVLGPLFNTIFSSLNEHNSTHHVNIKEQSGKIHALNSVWDEEEYYL